MIGKEIKPEGPQVAGYTCKGCKHFHSEYWKEPDGEGNWDSGTSASCLLLGRHIASYYGSSPTPPNWCPKPHPTLSAAPAFATRNEVLEEAAQALEQQSSARCEKCFVGSMVDGPSIIRALKMGMP